MVQIPFGKPHPLAPKFWRRRHWFLTRKISGQTSLEFQGRGQSGKASKRRGKASKRPGCNAKKARTALKNPARPRDATPKTQPFAWPTAAVAFVPHKRRGRRHCATGVRPFAAMPWSKAVRGTNVRNRENKGQHVAIL